jgi:hypothetical protein
MPNASNSLERFERPRLGTTDNHRVNALTPQRCQARANECAHLASQMAQVNARGLLLQVAASWRWLADELSV